MGEEISNTGSLRRKMLSNITLQVSCPCAHNQHSLTLILARHAPAALPQGTEPIRGTHQTAS